MTNETSYAPIKYVCNGVSVDFVFPWKIFEEKDLIVQAQGESGLLRELTLGVDYSVEFDEVGGNVKLNQTYAEGDLVVISRNVSDYQSKSYSTSSGFQSSEIEDSFDRVSCNLQEMEYNIENFKEVFSTQVHDEIDALENVIEENKQEVLLIQERFEEEVDNEIANLKTDVDSKVADVADAADKINALDESIAKCESAASEASEQAQIATSKAEELLNIKDELEAEIENKADVDLSNLSEIGIKKLGGGGGLEVGFIGFTQGYIDETKNLQRYLNKADNYIIQDQFEAFTKWLKKSAELNPDMVCTNEEYETALAMSVDNTCDKYVIDDEAGTIRLPKYPDYFIGGLSIPSGNIPVAGNGMTLGLTDGSTNSGLIRGGQFSNSGAIGNALSNATEAYGKSVNTQANTVTFSQKYSLGITKDASKSGIVAKLSESQTEQIKGHYFIQVATGASTSIDTARAVEIVTPYFYGKSEYHKVQPNNPSLLKSTGTYLSKAVHSDYYDWLLRIFNGTETQEGVSVKDASATDITDYDFVINQTDETFRLPLLNGSETIPDFDINKRVSKDKGSATSLNIAEKNCFVAFKGASDATYGTGAQLLIKQSDGSFLRTNGASGAGLSTLDYAGFVFISKGTEYYVISSVISHCYEYPCIGNGDLYYYVGEGIVNPQLVNVARIEEKIIDLIPDNKSLISNYAMPSDKYIDLTLGASGTEYIAPANGYFMLAYFVLSADGQVWLENCSAKMESRISAKGLWAYTLTLPVSKGDVIYLGYQNSFTQGTFTFTYAEGEV